LVRTYELGEGVAPNPEQMQLTEQGAGYYDSATRSMVFLNPDLLEMGRMYLPEEIIGDACLSQDWKTVDYCTEEGVVSLNLQTNISHLLKEQEALHQKVTGSFGNGEVLRYVLEQTENQEQTLLIDATTGMVLKEGAYLEGLVTWQEQYYLPMDISGITQLRFGGKEEHEILWPEEENGRDFMLFPNSAIVMVTESADGANLSYYDLTTGKRTGTLSLPSITNVRGLWGDGDSGVWLVGSKGETEQLYHWNVKKAPASDTGVYTEPLYTQEKPNEEKLTVLAQTAKELGERFGVEILLWKDAAATAPEDYVFTAEYIVQAYEEHLPRLEKVLSAYPKGFFNKAPGGKMKIALVQRISGEPEWGGLENPSSWQFWKGDVPILALTTGEKLEQSFYHAVAHYIDTLVLSKSSALYEWNKLNPKEFEYDNSYVTNLERTDTTDTEGDNRYFIDLFSMSYAKEDRATILEYACMPGNEEFFRSPVIQEKLNRICKGIREAFGLKKVETPFLWEQYLT